MVHQRPASVPVAILGVAIVLAVAPALVRANTITYELTNNSAAGTSAIDQVIANVSPPGLINEDTTSPTGPVTILPGSQGFNKNGLVVSVGNGTIPAGSPDAGNPYQLLLLTFEKGGFAPGGVLNFTLDLTNPNATPPQLQLPPSSAGLQLVQLNGTPPPPTSVGNNVPPVTNSPEPLSLVLWSALAGGGLIRARRIRKASLIRN